MPGRGWVELSDEVYETDDPDVIAALKDRPRDKHVCITGRNAAPELIEIADLVTEMKLIKHPFEAGVKAQAGIEF